MDTGGAPVRCPRRRRRPHPSRSGPRSPKPKRRGDDTATLAQLTGEASIALELVRVVETGEPVLVQAKAQVVAHGQLALARDLVVTNHDIACLIAALRDLAAGSQPHFELQTLEQHAIVTGQTGEDVVGRQPHGAISLWVGEPYRLMRGIRIMTAFDAILAFCADLEAELTGMVQRVAD